MNVQLNDPDFEVAYLGPEGSFSHLVVQQRFPERDKRFLKPFRTVPEVFEYVGSHEHAKGIVPIENSSGGMIRDTVDGIIEHAVAHSCSLFIQEELSLNVRLALLGKTGRTIKRIYSHFAPLDHCASYLATAYPDVTTVARPSTSASAEAALSDEEGAAIGPTATAEIYGLDVLEYDLRKEVPNVTQFFVVGHGRPDASQAEKTSLVVALPNRAGSLVDFLVPWKNAGINLTRIESRPIVGQPNTYRFLIELIGCEMDPRVRAAMDEAKKVSTQFYDVGCYPVLPRYQS